MAVKKNLRKTGFHLELITRLIYVVCWLEVHGRIDTSLLSTNTRYAAYLVYKSTPHTYGFEYQPAEVSVGLCGVENQTDGKIKTVFLDPEACERQRYENEYMSERC
ncbi:hypothetical protein R6Q59_007184 [Mikania micrantha]